VEVIAHYNKYQLWIGVFIGLLTGFSQFLRYKEHDFSKNRKRFLQHTVIGLIASGILTFLGCMWINATAWQYKLLMFMGIFATVSNLDYLIFFIKGNLKIAGSAIAHMGFGLMIIGVLASGLNKKHISTNPFAQRGLISDDMLGQNILLFEGEPMFMSGYKVTYVNDTIVDKTRFYKVNYQKLNQNGEVVEEFDLHPNALYDNKFTKVAAFNPSTKHYWYKDIFSHIPALPPSQSDAKAAKEIEDSLNYQTYVSSIGAPFEFEDIVPIEDSTFTKKFTYTINGINRSPEHEEYTPEMGDLAVGLVMTIKFEGKDSIFNVEPVIVIRGELLYNFPAQINDLALKVRLTESSLNQIIIPEQALAYQDFELKEGDFINFNGQKIIFSGFNRRPSHPSYVPEEEDIAVGSMLKIEGKDNAIYNAQPIYFIRGNRPFNLKDEVEELGLHFRFNRIDPTKESILISVAHHSNTNPVIPIEIATNSFRDDFIVLEAIEFPGINFFWLGSIMMMLGLGMSMVFRMAQRRKAI